MEFSKPKVWDPNMATALAARPAPTPQREKAAQNICAQDLGFEADAELEDRNKELSELVVQLQAAVAAAKDGESLATKKLQSFQQVDRSQKKLMRAELDKYRRRLTHTQQVAERLQKQTAWLQANSPVLTLPVELQGLPREEEGADEGAELAQHHLRWENDVAQLAATMQAELASGGTVAGLAQDDGSARQRVLELEAFTNQQSREVEQLRRELLERPQAAGAGGYPAAASGGAPAALAVMDSAGLRQELEGKEEEAKEQINKMKQLAKAYKELDKNKKDLESRLALAERSLGEAAARPPQRAAISPELVGRIRSTLASERAKIAELKASVNGSFQQQLPMLLQEALQQQMPRLQHLVASGAEEWKTKFLVESDRRRKLHNLVQELKGNIRVYCRVRPQHAHEIGTCISFPDADEIQIVNADLGLKKAWQFNEVFKQDSTQEMLFGGIRDLVVSMLDGYNVCIFAYGQTGAGKTHSMQGSNADPGIYQRTFSELFKVASERQGAKVELMGSILEIYNEEIRDLLNQDDKKPKLAVKMLKDGTNNVPGLSKEVVTSTQDVEALLERGQKSRKTAATDMNNHSSRSHLLVQIYGCVTAASGKTTNSCITLVDLAGSERLAKSGVEGDRAKEAISINKSLSALGDVINARATKSSHTPFRNSTLTHLLQDSLSGDSKTLMLLQINPCAEYVEESLCSLQFGARVNAVEMSGGKK